MFEAIEDVDEKIEPKDNKINCSTDENEHKTMKRENECKQCFFYFFSLTEQCVLII